MNNKLPRFQEALEFHLNVKLQKFIHKKINKETLNKIYFEIFDTINIIFSKSSSNISEYTKKWISQKYYDLILVSDSPILSNDMSNEKLDKVYDKIDIKQVPIHDLLYIKNLFNESSFYSDIIK